MEGDLEVTENRRVASLRKRLARQRERVSEAKATLAIVTKMGGARGRVAGQLDTAEVRVAELEAELQRVLSIPGQVSQKELRRKAKETRKAGWAERSKRTAERKISALQSELEELRRLHPEAKGRRFRKIENSLVFWGRYIESSNNPGDILEQAHMAQMGGPE